MYSLILPVKLFFKRRITILATAAVALCVFIVIVVMTVMNGLTEDFIVKNHLYYADCVVSTESMTGFSGYEKFISELLQQEYVKAAAPVINTFGLVQAVGTGGNAALNLTGIDIKRQCAATNFADTLYYRKDAPLKAFEPLYEPDKDGCVAGIDLLVDRTKRGKYLQLEFLPQYKYAITCFPLTARGTIRKTGTAVIPNSQTFIYSDNSNSGLAKIDSTTIYLEFDKLQRLAALDGEEKRTSAIYVKFNDEKNTAHNCSKVKLLWQQFAEKNKNASTAYLFDNVSVRDWKTYRRDTIAPMEKEQVMLILLFILLGIITVFIIFVVFYMLINKKTGDIGILKAIGMSGCGIVKVFINLAALLGAAGAAVGTAGALVFLKYVNPLEDFLYQQYGFQMWNREIYAIGSIPNRTKFTLVAVVAAAAVAAAVLGAAVPTIKAANSKCVDLLRTTQL